MLRIGDRVMRIGCPLMTLRRIKGINILDGPTPMTID